MPSPRSLIRGENERRGEVLSPDCFNFSCSKEMCCRSWSDQVAVVPGSLWVEMKGWSWDSVGIFFNSRTDLIEKACSGSLFR